MRGCGSCGEGDHIGIAPTGVGLYRLFLVCDDFVDLNHADRGSHANRATTGGAPLRVLGLWRWFSVRDDVVMWFFFRSWTH